MAKPTRSLLILSLLVPACIDTGFPVSSLGSTADPMPEGTTSTSAADETGASSTTEPGSEGDTAPVAAPEILEITAAPSRLSEGDILTLTAVVTDPDGLADIVGVALRAPDDTLYGVFSQVSAGTFSTAISWAQIHAVIPIEFTSPEQRPFRIDVTDAAALVTSETLQVTLTCDQSNAEGACDGQCVALDSLEHCGACGVECPLDGGCVQGRCVSPCGNGVIDPGEQCDGDDLQGFDCESLGLSGDLSCGRNCTFDTSSCM
ncbi:MAG: hypothetical protein K0V04_19200 [Deltaproteobacteria bacterium]|nr:hypothetical protein [Deltaproteobacteria bacterium]